MSADWFSKKLFDLSSLSVYIVSCLHSSDKGVEPVQPLVWQFYFETKIKAENLNRQKT